MTKKDKNNGCSPHEHPAQAKTPPKPKFKLRGSPPCKHLNIVPYVMRAERVTYHANTTIIDRECSIINGQWLRVEKYYCPECETFIEPPKE